MPYVSCPRCVRGRSVRVNGHLQFKSPNKGCKLCGGKGIVYCDSVPPSYYESLEGWTWHPFEDKPALGWVANGIAAYAFFGVIFTVLFDFTPPLTYIKISDSWHTILVIFGIYSIFGGVIGLLGYVHYQGIGYASHGFTTQMFLWFYGLILNTIMSYFFIYFPEIQSTTLKRELIRCTVGAVTGFFASGLLGARSLKQFPTKF